ncbi:hypothetical protein SAMN05518672_104119 [Chitinophaga sp. CF118]|uniref:hypothetical protein n=1 Tax=Chitinophaga sp. CF118 TaxID=1884367 RepID=UPI0008F0A0CF|nr:hypothetical protein [Chitinophaga sp. CF118]SFE00672.1 hypothetical protein SAMN05518672_104119 [Chitinophaga sp. CF118]
MKKKKSEKFLKNSLQLLALQFPDIRIRYGYETVLTDTHIVELIPDECDSNETLLNACSAIGTAFSARFFCENVIFTSSDNSLEIKEPIFEWNNGISEFDRLYNKMCAPYLSDSKEDNNTEPLVEKDMLRC